VAITPPCAARSSCSCAAAPALDKSSAACRFSQNRGSVPKIAAQPDRRIRRDIARAAHDLGSGGWPEHRAASPGRAPTGQAGRDIPRARLRRDEFGAEASCFPIVAPGLVEHRSALAGMAVVFANTMLHATTPDSVIPGPRQEARPGMTAEGLQTRNKNPGIAAGVLPSLMEVPGLRSSVSRCIAPGMTSSDQKSIPPMPPPGGMPPPPAPAFFFGSSAIMASVVIRRAATEAAFWIAARTTLVGSMMPFLTRSP
jgi:hypothetical protein